MIFTFGVFDLDTDLFELRRAGTPVAVEPQVFSVLAHLIEHRDRVVPKTELLDSVWGSRFVSESALTTRIKAARRAVGDDGQQQRIIKTVHGRGYRFAAPVHTTSAKGVAVPPPAPCLDPEPAADLPAEPTAETDAGVTSVWPIVGRGRELELLARSFRDESTGGVLLTGGAGVGKTRLAEACVELAEASGLPSARAAGHPEGRSIPFAALAHLLPPDVASGRDDDLDRARVFHRARAALLERAGGERMLLLVDDGDQLDDLSRALVTSLVKARTVFAVLTMRTASNETPFDHLMKDGDLVRLTIEPLPHESVETLLHRVLGGPLVAESLLRLSDAAMGNPGVLRQLVETAVHAGTLAAHDGVWRLSGPLQPTRSFVGLVAERLGGLDDAHLHAAELLAVAGEMALDGLALVAGHGVLEDLEHRGLLTARTTGRRASISLAHPLFDEVLLRQLPALRGRRLRRELAGAVEAVGARRRDDRVRLVAWRIDGGGDVDPQLVLNAARLALLEGDNDIAERLITRAAADGGGTRATALLAELHFRRDHPEKVEAVLGGIDLAELNETERARIVRRRSGNLYYGLTDPPGAIAMLDECLPLFTEREPMHAVQAHRATILSMDGQIDAALEATVPLMKGERNAIRFDALRARAYTLRAAGRGEDALELIAEATALYDEFEPDLSRPGRSIVMFSELFALTELGRLDEARDVGDRAVGDGPIGARTIWLAFGRPRIELLAGNAAAALSASEDSALDVRARGALGAERWVLAVVGMARLLAGDADAGGRDIDRVAKLWPQDVGLFRSDRDRAFAWLAAERDGLSAARQILITGAESARRRGAFALEAMLLHDVVRFGGAGAVAERLTEMPSFVQGGLALARADHAVGVVAADTGRLMEAVAGFERAGSSLLAAEAALDLADAAWSHGDASGADRGEETAYRLMESLDSAVSTPRLRHSVQSGRSRPAG